MALPQSNIQEMIIFVGSPASGKSIFWRNYFSMHSNYKRIDDKTTTYEKVEVDENDKNIPFLERCSIADDKKEADKEQ